VGAVFVRGDYFGLNLYRQTENKHFGFAFGQAAAQGTLRLIADQHHRVFWVTEIVAQMVQYASAFTHAGRGYYNGGCFERVKLNRIALFRDVLDPAFAERVADFCQFFKSGVQSVAVFGKNGRGFFGERTVHINRYAANIALLVQFFKQGRYLLHPAQRESGNKNLAAAFNCAQYDFPKVFGGIGRIVMQAVAVS